MSASHPPQRWTFTQATPVGEVRSSYELSADGLRFDTDATTGSAGAMTLRWGEIREAATAVLDLPGGGRSGPDLGRWVPERLEWLLLARADGQAQDFMRPLPTGDEARHAFLEALRGQLGSRWVGDRLPLQEARHRFRLDAPGGTLKVIALVVSVLVALFLLLLVFATAWGVFGLPAGMLAGAWCIRHGLNGLRDALQMASTPTAKVSSAAMGTVELQGRAVSDRPVPAGASGRPSVYWDLAVDVWSEHRDDGGWKQVLARHGGEAGLLTLADSTGQVPIWLRDADVLLEPHVWETGRHVLPEAGIALLAGTAFPWDGGQRMRVRETRIEVGAPLYVYGTLDEARHVDTTSPGPLTDRVARALRTGSWRPVLMARLPALLRPTVAVTIAYIDLLTGVGRGGERILQARDAAPPVLDDTGLLVWKGRAGRALIVADHRETTAIEQLRQRSLWFIGGGVLLTCWCLYEFIDLF